MYKNQAPLERLHPLAQQMHHTMTNLNIAFKEVDKGIGEYYKAVHENGPLNIERGIKLITNLIIWKIRLDDTFSQLTLPLQEKNSERYKEVYQKIHYYYENMKSFILDKNIGSRTGLKDIEKLLEIPKNASEEIERQRAKFNAQYTQPCNCCGRK